MKWQWDLLLFSFCQKKFENVANVVGFVDFSKRTGAIILMAFSRFLALYPE